MAIITVKIFDHEKEAMLKAVKKFKGKTVAVSALSREAGINPNRGRFVLDELLQEDKVKKIATKAYNPQYVRYTYEVI
jgi:hypothetical protein